MKKKILITLMIIFAIFAMNDICNNTVMAATKVKISKKNFPDDSLRKMIKDEFDKNKDGYISDKECKNVDYIRLDKGELVSKYQTEFYYRNEKRAKYAEKKIKESYTVNCKGLEYFPKIEYLEIRTKDNAEDIGKGKIKNLKVVNKLKKLQSLVLSNDKTVKKLDFTKLKDLKVLKLYYFRKLDKIDICNNSKLEYLGINAPINKITFKANKNLKEVHLLACKNLKKVDFRHNKKIKVLEVSGCAGLKTLDLQKNIKLTEFKGYYTRLKRVLFSPQNKLKAIDLHTSNIKAADLDMVNKKTLISLKIYESPISQIDISKFEKLQELHCSSDIKVIMAEGQTTEVIGYEPRSQYIKGYGSWLLNNKKTDWSAVILGNIPHL